MITLRLFEASNPFQQIDERRLGQGEIVIGRDPSADWVITDKHGDVSRRHCVVSMWGGELYLVDTSTNGVRLGPDERAAPRHESVRLAPGDMIHLGHYMILIDRPSADASALRSAQDPATPPPGPAGPLTDAALLEQFCAGARLEPSSFAGEAPGEVMARLGAAYRQVVDDLCDLMRDRAASKHGLNLDRTTISARENNPLKWEDAERVAVELLQEGQTGFLKGAAAFRASFDDLRRHSACLVAGSQAAVDEVVGLLDPDVLESALKRQPLAFVSRHETLWKRYRELHAGLKQEASPARARIEDAMRAAYERRLAAMAKTGNAA